MHEVKKIAIYVGIGYLAYRFLYKTLDQLWARAFGA